MNSYTGDSALRAAAYRVKPSPIILGIETSCDETAAAVVRGGRAVIGSAVHTQIPMHRLYGGVVPEIASRSHTERIVGVVRAALEDAKMSLSDMDAIAVTYRPGLIGALLVGVSYAKGLAYAAGLPLIGVDHITGHIAANYITYAELEPPFMCIVASGGHSHIVRVDGYTEFALIGRTRDDAAGEAFDKVARALGLPYPGGPELEALAKTGDTRAYRLHAAFNEGEGYDFSFSGVKTAVVNILHNAEQKGEPVNKSDVAASFQRAVVDALTTKAVRATMQSGLGTLALAGGVSANSVLRSRLQAECDRFGIRFCRPDMRYCTDNAAMIACQGHYELMSGKLSDLNMDPSAASFLNQ